MGACDARQTVAAKDILEIESHNRLYFQELFLNSSYRLHLIGSETNLQKRKVWVLLGIKRADVKGPKRIR